MLGRFARVTDSLDRENVHLLYKFSLTELRKESQDNDLEGKQTLQNW